MQRSLGLVAALFVLGAAGCSDSSEDAAGNPANAPRGGLYMTIAPTASTSCPSQGHSKSIGDPPPSYDAQGQTVADGQSGASVACSVSGSGTFAVTASIAQATTELSIEGDVPAHGVGSGLVDYTDDVVAVSLSSPASMPCTILTLDDPMQASPGSVFAKLNCSSIATASAECTLAGVFVFENCADE